MKTKKENPVLLLLKWAEKDRGFLIASVICAFLGGLLLKERDINANLPQNPGW